MRIKKMKNEPIIKFNSSWNEQSNEEILNKAINNESKTFKKEFNNTMKKLNFNKIKKVPKIDLMEEIYLITKENDFK